MPQFKIKRVYETAEKSDGFRVLVDKLWPRGVKKEDLHYDLWAKDIAPSTALRQWVHENKEERWNEFSKAYTKELKENPATKEFLKDIKSEKIVSLLYAAKDETQNHALVLKKFLEASFR